MCDDESTSLTMGTAVLMSGLSDGDSRTNSRSSGYEEWPPVTKPIHIMGDLSLSAIAPVDTSTDIPTSNMLSLFSPNYKPDVLVSTYRCYSKLGPVPTKDETDLSISMGPLAAFLTEGDDNGEEEKVTPMKILAKVDEINRADACIQTCSTWEDQVRLEFDRKLAQVISEFHGQLSGQAEHAEQQTVAARAAQERIDDLVSQLDGADKKLKACRVFLDQQTLERELEREEAGHQLQLLTGSLAEREKEYERAKNYLEQMTSELELFQQKEHHWRNVEQENAALRQTLEQDLQLARSSLLQLEHENNNLNNIVDVKDRLLQAQAAQISALQSELEKQLLLHNLDNTNSPEPIGDEHDRSASSLSCRNMAMHGEDGGRRDASDSGVPSLFDELQNLIVNLLRKVEKSTRSLESVQWAKPQAHLSPRGAPLTPSTSTEDISLRDRHDPPGVGAGGDPQVLMVGGSERATLSFLHQLDAKMAALSRVEEAACKRLDDLEAELRRTARSEKDAVDRVAVYQQNLKDMDGEKRELLLQHTELLRRISCLENRLEEQRRSATLGASLNTYAEQTKVLSEEKQQLQQQLERREEDLNSARLEVEQLQLRVTKLLQQNLPPLHKQVTATDSGLQTPGQSRLQTPALYDSCRERLRDAPEDGNGSLSWGKLTVPNSPLAPDSGSSPRILQLKEICGGCTELQDRLRDLEQRSQELHESRRQVEIMQDHARKLDERLQESQKRADEIQDRADDLQDRLQESRKHADENRDRTDDLQQRLQESQDRVHESQKRENEIQNCADTLQQRLQESQDRARALEQCLQESKDGWSKDQDLQAELKDVRRELKQLECRLEKSKESCDNAERLLEAAVASRASLSLDYDSLLRQTANIQQELDSCRQLVRDGEQEKRSSEKQLQRALQNCDALQRALSERQETCAQLEARLRSSDQCRVTVEQAVQQLQQEVELLKKLRLPATPAFEEPAAPSGSHPPPDLLAPSFVEFLSCSRISSSPTPSSSSSEFCRIARRVGSKSLGSTMDYSLPSSMAGKTILKSVLRQGEELLAHIMRSTGATASGDQDQDRHDQEPDETLKAEDDGRQQEHEEAERVAAALRAELAVERLLLNDLRAANALQQQQFIKLLAQQRMNSTVFVGRNRKPSDSSDAAVGTLRTLRLQSRLKNLAFQKKFLVRIVTDLTAAAEPQTDQPAKRTMLNRFRVAVLVVMSIRRMQYIQQVWQQRRRTYLPPSPATPPPAFFA